MKKAAPGKLKKRADYLRLQKDGKKWVSPTVIVQAGTGETGAIRYGLTATKKTGNAVIRNRIKRRLREAVRAVLPDTDLPFDIVLIGRTETAECDFTNLKKDLRWCLKRLGVVDAEKPA